LKILKKLLILEIQNSAKTLKAFEDLKEFPEFNLYLIFQTLLPPKQDTINAKTLFLFLRNQGFPIENFDPLQNKFFCDLKELTYRDFSLFFFKIGGLDPLNEIATKTRNFKEMLMDLESTQKRPPNSQIRRNTAQISSMTLKNVKSYDEVLKRKNSSDYVQYLMKVRNAEAKVAKIQAFLPKKSLNLMIKKGVDSFFFELLQNQLKIEKEIENMKEDLALRADISISTLINLFDFENKGFITINNLQALVPDGSDEDERDLIAFIGRYTKSNRNFLG
jgi:hypothetical protein